MEEEWLACESGKSSAGSCTGWRQESYRERARKPRVSEKYYVGSGQCSTIKVKTWRKEMSGFSEEFREVGGLD